MGLESRRWQIRLGELGLGVEVEAEVEVELVELEGGDTHIS
jgi:hypothetical protein